MSISPLFSILDSLNSPPHPPPSQKPTQKSPQTHFHALLTPPPALLSSTQILSNSLTPSQFLSHLQSLAKSREILESEIERKKRAEMVRRLQRDMLKWVTERDWERVVECLRVVRDQWEGSDALEQQNATSQNTSMANQRNYVLQLLTEEFEGVMDAPSPDYSTIIKYVTYIGKLGAPVPQRFQEYLTREARNELSQELAPIDDFTQKIHIIMDFMAGEVEKQESFLLETFGYEEFVEFVLEMQKLTDEMCQQTISDMVNVRKLNKKVQQIEEWKRKEARQGHARTTSSGSTDGTTAPSQDTTLISDLDKTLEEITVICSKIEMYARFMDNKMMMAYRKHAVGTSAQGSATLASTVPTPSSAIPTPSTARTQPDSTNFAPQHTTIAMTQIKKELSLHYLTLEHHFLELSIAKAINLNAQQKHEVHPYFGASQEDVSQNIHSDESNSDDDSSSALSEDDETLQKHSSLVNDLFFIIRKSIHRACNSFSQDTVCKVLNDVHIVLHDTVKPELSKALKKYVRSKRPGDSVQYTTAQLHAISIALNDLRICSDYMHKMKQEVMHQAESLFAHEAQENIKHFANQLLKLSTDYKDSVEKHIQILVSSSFEYPVNEALDAFREAKYDINDAEFSQYEVSDPFVDQFTEVLDEWIEPFHDYFIQANYEHFVVELVKLTVQLLTHAIIEENKPFSQLGGIQLDKDLRSLIRYFGEKTETSIRDKFGELNQIAFILKVSSLGEMLEFWNDSTMQSIWKFKDAERVRRVLMLRSDLDQQQVQSLHL